MKEYSEITQRFYDPDCGDYVFFRNCSQSARYIEWGATLYDLFTDSEHKLVFVFSREDHNRFKSRWGTRENNQVTN